MVWETIGGQKDPTGAVLMSDGSLRCSAGGAFVPADPPACHPGIR